MRSHLDDQGQSGTGTGESIGSDGRAGACGIGKRPDADGSVQQAVCKEALKLLGNLHYLVGLVHEAGEEPHSQNIDVSMFTTAVASTPSGISPRRTASATIDS
jgi:hypothetical protein